MDDLEPLLSGLINKTYVRQGIQGIASRHALFKSILSTRNMPEIGWDELSIELLLAEIAAMDSNNFPSNIGAGEREGRVYSSIVARRHFRLSHGIGRSGDIAEVQPKSAGSSIIAKLTHFLLQNALKICGLTQMKHIQILPLATGMTLMMCMSALKSIPIHSNKQDNEEEEEEGVTKYVIFPRIDQKSCFKSILSANLIPLSVETTLIGDELHTDLAGIEEYMQQYGNKILCVLSTTSCFAPRCPDKIDEIALLCQKYNIGHIVNNAYGVQCQSISQLINRAMTVGRVDYIVSSLDKNFLVPVGGAFVGSSSNENIEIIRKLYPGRASIGPTLDLFITLLSMGKRGLTHLLERREVLFRKLSTGLQTIAVIHGERLLATPMNPISMGLTLTNEDLGTSTKEVTFLGSMLFQRCISGARVVPLGNQIIINNNYTFEGWGGHYNSYPCAYLTAACAIGMTEDEVDLFLEKLNKILGHIKNKNKSAT